MWESALLAGIVTQPAPVLTGAILAYVFIQRLVELRIARRNTSRLLNAGAIEVAREHYPFIVLLHAGWLLGLLVLAWSQPINLWLLGLFALVQAARFWTLATLGSRWTTRLVVVPGEILVTTGPFRLASHPNYFIVIAEILLLPLVFSLPVNAAVFSAANAAVLIVRITAEERALMSSRLCV